MNEVAEKVTLKDIAKYVDKSVATVSMALAGSDKIHEETRQKIQNACLELGYRTQEEITARLNSNAQKRKVKRICLLVCGGNPWQVLGPFLDALVEEAGQFNARLEIIKANPEVSSVLDELTEHQADLDGFIITNLVDRNVFEAVSVLSMPGVMAGPVTDYHLLAQKSQHLPIIDYNVIQMARMAVNALAAKGHRRISLICHHGPKGLYFSRWLDGYILGLNDNGIAYDADLCVIKTGKDTALFTENFSRVCRSNNPPTALIVPGPFWVFPSIEVGRKCQLTFDESNIILGGNPKQFSNLGVHGYPYISPDWQQLAHQTFSILDQQLQHKSQRGSVLYTPFYCNDFDKLKTRT